MRLKFFILFPLVTRWLPIFSFQSIELKAHSYIFIYIYFFPLVTFLESINSLFHSHLYKILCGSSPLLNFPCLS